MMTDSALSTALTPVRLRAALHDAGYRVDEVQAADGTPGLRSATAGLGFVVQFANPREAGTFADAVFQAVFQVQGELPLSLVNAWNVGRRFARLSLAGDVLVLSLDVLGVGGIGDDHLRAWCAIWDRLVQELIAYLRAELPKLAKAAPVAEPAVAESTPDAA